MASILARYRSGLPRGAPVERSAAATGGPGACSVSAVRGDRPIPCRSVEEPRGPCRIVIVLVADAGQPVGGGALVDRRDPVEIVGRLLVRGQDLDARHLEGRPARCLDSPATPVVPVPGNPR